VTILPEDSDAGEAQWTDPEVAVEQHLDSPLQAGYKSAGKDVGRVVHEREQAGGHEHEQAGGREREQADNRWEEGAFH
jgi:hypothetical protein